MARSVDQHCSDQSHGCLMGGGESKSELPSPRDGKRNDCAWMFMIFTRGPLTSSSGTGRSGKGVIDLAWEGRAEMSPHPQNWPVWGRRTTLFFQLAISLCFRISCTSWNSCFLSFVKTSFSVEQKPPEKQNSGAIAFVWCILCVSLCVFMLCMMRYRELEHQQSSGRCSLPEWNLLLDFFFQKTLPWLGHKMEGIHYQYWFLNLFPFVTFWDLAVYFLSQRVK